MSDNGRRIGVLGTEQQWAHCVGLMTYAAMKASEDCESDDEKAASLARSLAPALYHCRELIDRITDAVPKVVAR